LSGTTLLVFVAIAGCVIAGLWLGAKRRKELVAWAADAGLSFSLDPDRTIEHRYPEFGCLRRGHSRYAYNIASGTWNGRTVESFDYRYVTGQGKDRTTHTFSAVILTSRLRLKPLRLRTENVFDKLTEFVGVEDIDFESAEFSRAFYVTSPDKKWAYDVLHQRTMEFLLASPRFSIEFDAGHVICWRNRRFNLQARAAAMGVAEGILDRLPEYVIREQNKGEQ
jgi:hypothetical protein